MQEDFESNSIDILEQQFSGPSLRIKAPNVGFQEGDMPHSQSSFSLDLSPNQINNSSQRILNFKTERPTIQKEIQQTQTKPEFLRLIIGKRLQSNFINNLWNKSYLRKLHQLSKYQIDTLDDLLFSNNDNTEQQNVVVLIPYSKIILLWNISQIFLLFFIFLWLPFKISFDIDSISSMWGVQGNYATEIIIILLLFIDVIVGMNLAFIDKGQIINNRKKILLNYLRKQSFVDIVSLIALIMQSFDEDQITLFTQVLFGIVFYMLRLNKIKKIVAQIHEFFNLNGQLNDLVALIQVITIIIYIIHIFACVWNGVGQLNYADNWIDHYGYTDSAIYTKYNAAVYWATMTITTVGYGDITGKNDIETAVNNITMMIGTIVFAYSVNSIGIFVSNMYKSKQEYNRTITLINSYMSKNKIQFNLQTRIRSYLQYIWDEEQQMNEEEVGSIISKLSSNLQDELNFHIKGNILQNCDIIAKTFSAKFQKHLLQAMEEHSYSPQERIIKVNQIDDCSLYIITKGAIEIIYEGINLNGEVQKRNLFQTLKPGDYFGEISFITENPRTATAIANEFVRVFKIKRENLLKLLTQYPTELEKFCQLRDQLFRKDTLPFAIQCYSCNSNSHLINECHVMHFIADKEAIIKRENFPRKQLRKIQFRSRLSKRLHPWLTTIDLAIKARLFSAHNFIVKNDEEIEGEEIDEAWDGSSPNDFQDESNDQVSSSKNKINSQSVSVINIQNDQDGEEVNKTSKLIKISLKPQKNRRVYVHNNEQKCQDDPSSEIKKLSQLKIAQDRETIINPSSRMITIIKEITNEDRPSIEQLERIQRQTSKNKSVTHKFGKGQSILGDCPQNFNTTFFDSFDKLMNFTHYFPLNNYETVLKRYLRTQKGFGKKKIFPASSSYSFQISTIRKGYKLRRMCEDLAKNDGRANEEKKRSSNRTKPIQFS